jgi:hypothetical protein
LSARRFDLHPLWRLCRTLRGSGGGKNAATKEIEVGSAELSAASSS